MGVHVQLELAEHTESVARRLAKWGEDDVLARVWARDHRVWTAEPVAELTDRLGWLTLPHRLGDILGDLKEFGDGLRADGIAHVVVLGMGGSSLAPEVFAKTFASAAGAPELLVLDSTHPAAVVATGSAIDLERTVFIVASKSGTTIEPLSFFEYFWERVAAVSSQPGEQFVATTDPGSQLAELASARGFRRTFLAPPDVGGRYSALTEFGMVPAAAIGMDLEAVHEAALAALGANDATTMVAVSPACRLGAALGELALAGRDKVTFLTSPDLAAVPAWIEQLIAESTGKNDKGIVPIGGEEPGPASAYSADRFFVLIETAGSAPVDRGSLGHHPIASIALDAITDLAGAMYVLEMATALAGAAIGIQPFDQPDVQLAKELARDAMKGTLDLSEVVEIDVTADDLEPAVERWLGGVASGDYVGIQAFIEPTDAARSHLGTARIAIRDATRAATTLDFGPRFLHSTGQLHKGGPNSGVFLEIIDHPTPALAVPNTDYDFGALITAQAHGDHLALRHRGRRVLLVTLAETGVAGLQRLVAVIERAAR